MLTGNLLCLYRTCMYWLRWSRGIVVRSLAHHFNRRGSSPGRDSWSLVEMEFFLSNPPLNLKMESTMTFSMHTKLSAIFSTHQIIACFLSMKSDIVENKIGFI